MIVRSALLWLSIVALLVVFRGVLLVFGGAILIAYLIGPLVQRISEVRVRGRATPRWVGILAVYAFFFVALYGFSVAAVPQLYREVVRLSAEARSLLNDLSPERIAGYTERAEAWLDTHGIPLVFGEAEPLPTSSDGGVAPGHGAGELGPKLHFDLEAAIRTAITGSALWLKGHLLELVEISQRFVARTLGGVFTLFFMLMVSAFLLIDVGSIQRFFRSLVPFEWRPGFDELLLRIDEKLAGVVRGQIAICLINGALTLIGLLLLQVKFALILASIATVLSFIPIFGTVISTVPIVLVGLTQGLPTAMAALAWILGIHAIEAYGLNPKILGDSAKIHPVVIAFALLAGERTFGFVGALLAVPIASVLLATFLYFKDRASRLEEAELASRSPEAPAATDVSAPLLGSEDLSGS